MKERVKVKKKSVHCFIVVPIHRIAYRLLCVLLPCVV